MAALQIIAIMGKFKIHKIHNGSSHQEFTNISPIHMTGVPSLIPI